jgi:hypothetical protein
MAAVVTVVVALAVLAAVIFRSEITGLFTKTDLGGVSVAQGVKVELPSGYDATKYKLSASLAPKAALTAVRPVVSELSAPREFHSSRPVPVGTKIRFDVQKGLNPDLVFEAYFDPSERRWIQEPTTYNPQTGVATATVAHFSVHGLFGWSIDRVKALLMGALSDVFSPLFEHVATPSCMAPNGVRMYYTGGEMSVIPCHDATIVQLPTVNNPGMANIRVKLANARHYAIDVALPASARDHQDDPVSAAQQIGAAITRFVSGASGKNMTLLPGGATDVIHLDNATAPFHNERIFTQDDGEAYLLQLLDTAIGELAWMYNAAPDGIAKDFLSELGTGEILRRALTELTSPDLSVGTVQTLGSIGLDVLLQGIEHGPYQPLGLVELTKVVINIIDDAWQTVSGFVDTVSGQSFHTYTFDTYGSIWGSTAATKKLYVSAVDSQGNIAPGLQVTRTANGASCEPGSEAIGSAYRCFAGNGVYDPCWADSLSPTPAVLCLEAPWSHNVSKLMLASNLPQLIGGTGNGPPWGLQLTDGRNCILEQGAHDSFDGRAVDYSCGGAEVVLRGLETASAQWRAQTALYSGGQYSMGPIEGIAIAWFGIPDSG